MAHDVSTGAPIFFYLRNRALAVIRSFMGYRDNIAPNFKALFPYILK